jgi:hypothetical protein
MHGQIYLFLKNVVKRISMIPMVRAESATLNAGQ